MITLSDFFERNISNMRQPIKDTKQTTNTNNIDIEQTTLAQHIINIEKTYKHKIWANSIKPIIQHIKTTYTKL